ncbi:zinc finger protein ZAT11-like [Hibiscus syriacus]|uniref:Zinc finger protein ZAT11-like n=1 Tax=Hibiscus syriacus TaxID=106335 RepID=A0A6A2WQF7_HIBSY|nr:zinc finger protein ZAT11-like [Hibiscus syriacus]KAE8657865.1 zinc finger protein ZAT11-like [Hibiscus syriacus]
MKRERENVNDIQGFDIAKCLMLLSQGFETTKKPNPSIDNEVFECKTCHRQFSSFQALGGHCASHKRPKLAAEKANEETHSFLSLSTKPKTHECSICGQEFSMGQALGGHMRRHRSTVNETVSPPFPAVSAVQVLKRSNSSRRVVCNLDLNLTPLENDFQVLFGNKAPKIDICF